MSEAYEETIDGDPVPRAPLDSGHELLVSRLHALVRNALPPNSRLQLLPPRTAVRLHERIRLCPDLAIVKPAADDTVELCLVAEVLRPGDHHLDTVVKKQIYADLRVPRLWMVDPRYLNVETYGVGEYGFTLTAILANRDPLTESCLPGLRCPMNELFADL